jgi:hypothetical protein
VTPRRQRQPLQRPGAGQPSNQSGRQDNGEDDQRPFQSEDEERVDQQRHSQADRQKNAEAG